MRQKDALENLILITHDELAADLTRRTTVANTDFGSPSDTMTDAASSLGDMASRVTDKASALGQKASEFGQKAVGAIDAQRGSAASALDKTAASVHASADMLARTVPPFAHQAADGLVATADYLREKKMRDMWADLEGFLKAHPTQALLGAVVVGFCAGRMLRRS
jgi:ABC-type transporter Mla subunit MlaD